MKRRKPKFLRAGWYRLTRIGKRLKRKRKWRASKGGDSKIRMRERGKATRPTIGWGSDKSIRGQIRGHAYTRIENLAQIEKLKEGSAVILAAVGKKKREELTRKAEEKKIIILNKYYKENELKK